VMQELEALFEVVSSISELAKGLTLSFSIDDVHSRCYDEIEKSFSRN